VSYFAAAVLSGPDGWTSSQVDLSGVADLEEAADRVRDVDSAATNAVMFVEADDLYLVIVRVDESDDVRVFGSDAAYADDSRLGALLLGDLEDPVLDIDEVATGDDEDDDATPATTADADPVGDADLLADLGVPGHKLMELCAQEGMMPSDITAEICELLGCADEIEELREA
jgi:putative tRNA adenosine deaminase-associated protein